MQSIFNSIVVSAKELGLLCFVVLTYLSVRRYTVSHDLLRQAGMGVLFAAAAVAAMLDPIHVTDGVFLDARNVLITLASAFGGPVAGVIAAIAASLVRVELGGAGTTAGIAAIWFCAFLGYGVSRLVNKPLQDWNVGNLSALAAVGTTSVATAVLLPPDAAHYFMTNVAAYYAVSVAAGIVLFGMFLIREERRFVDDQKTACAAFTDALTGLLNRAGLFRSLANNAPFSGMLMIDVDHFKAVNDAFGHNVGDETLVEIGRRISRAVAENGFVARLGGEEFACVATSTIESLPRLADVVLRAVNESPIQTSQGLISVTVSVGLSQRPDQIGLIDLMKHADEALYQAKATGRNRVVAAPTLRLVSANRMGGANSNGACQATG